MHRMLLSNLPQIWQDSLHATRRQPSLEKLRDDMPVPSQMEGPVQGCLQHLLQQLQLPAASDTAKISLMHAILRALPDSDALSSFREMAALRPFVDLLHSSMTQLQQTACIALGMLATDSKTALAMARADALEPLRRIVEDKDTSAASYDAAVAVNLILAGIYEFVSFQRLQQPHVASLAKMVEALSLSQPEKHLQAAAALAHITKFRECQLAAIRHVDGFLPALLGVIQSPASSPRIVAEAMTAVANLTQLPSWAVQQQLLDANAWPAVCEVLSRYSVDRSTDHDTHRIWAHAAQALLAMVLPDETDSSDSSPSTDTIDATVSDAITIACFGFFAINDVQQCSSPVHQPGSGPSSADAPRLAHHESLLEIVQRAGTKPLLGLLASACPSTQAHAAMWVGLWDTIRCTEEEGEGGSAFQGSREEKHQSLMAAYEQMGDLEQSQCGHVRKACLASRLYIEVSTR